MIYGLRLMDGSEHLFGEQRPPVECFCCGYCCVGYNPLVNDEEIGVMAEYLGISVREFKRRYIDETLIGYLIRQTREGCVFLEPDEVSGKAYCSIHPARPEVCRTWRPSLWRRECLTGLTQLENKCGRIMPAAFVFEGQEQLGEFISTLRQDISRESVL